MYESCTVYFSDKINNPLIAIDTDATLSLAPNASDFVGNIQPYWLKTLNGLSSQTEVVGQGKVAWTICDATGATPIFEIMYCIFLQRQ